MKRSVSAHQDRAPTRFLFENDQRFCTSTETALSKGQSFFSFNTPRQIQEKTPIATNMAILSISENPLLEV
ncbi:MAG: hypothetical protein JNM99_08330 [Verrucomicrobiaceae bacterium]|nr:hypothetical protein [Verrucomicrobiaceae bacterium]